MYTPSAREQRVERQKTQLIQKSEPARRHTEGEIIDSPSHPLQTSVPDQERQRQEQYLQCRAPLHSVTNAVLLKSLKFDGSDKQDDWV